MTSRASRPSNRGKSPQAGRGGRRGRSGRPSPGAGAGEAVMLTPSARAIRSHARPGPLSLRPLKGLAAHRRCVVEEFCKRSTMSKVFKIPAGEMREVAPGRGGCIASDRITVDGCRVGFMYREPSTDDVDSGWRILAGDESQQYMDDPDHLSIY